MDPDQDWTPVERVAGTVEAGVVLLCDHASNALPPAYGTLGLDPSQLRRHIGYDIGAAELTRRLAGLVGAPAVLSTFSRLLIDPNRGADDPTLVMRLSDGAIVPGNADVDAAEVERRLARYWRPYRAAVAEAIVAASAGDRTPVVFSIHSFTDRWKGTPRPWEVGILWDSDARLALPLIGGLRRAGFMVGDNEPYDGALRGDTLDEEVTRHGIAGLLIEVRQDLLATSPAIEAIADRIAPVLTAVAADPDLHARLLQPSRTGRHAA